MSKFPPQEDWAIKYSYAVASSSLLLLLLLLSSSFAIITSRPRVRAMRVNAYSDYIMDDSKLYTLGRGRLSDEENGARCRRRRRANLSILPGEKWGVLPYARGP